MNSRIKEIVSLLLKSKGVSSMKDAQQISNYFSVLYAMCLSGDDAYCYDDLLLRLKDADFFKEDFCSMISDFYDISSQLPETAKEHLFTCVKEIAANAGDNDVSWAYEYIKSSLATYVQKKRVKESNCKISGGDLLLTTQFFTDDYMVVYIVDTVFEQIKDSISETVFVDPACGGGNFLTYVSKKLFAWYKENTSLDELQIVERIYGEQIVGYDLDPNIAAIAKLSLILQRNKLCECAHSVPTILGGREHDALGYLTNDLSENIVKKELENRREKGKFIAFVTNPPFMGGRDLDPNVKSYLDKEIPLGMGDLCASFMCRMMMELKEGDILGSVLQNSWLFLSSYKELRREFLDHYSLVECADLGSHAFADISGEKANIVLAVITKNKKESVITRFINLRNKDYVSKRGGLLDKNVAVTLVDCQRFNDVSDYAFNYELVGVFRRMPKSKYGDFAHIMQGTSTGDSKNDVKFFWEIPSDNKDWVLVSKGGGFCKWSGLSYYKVLWGDRGEALRKNKGCALRNVAEISDTQLVYSDTGTIGLNVRQKREDQVFIASGPGIHSLKGHPECHQAFLNSKFATYWLKVSNPKLTISAGYIAKIPVTRNLLYSTQLKSLAEQCVSNKRQLLEGKLPNAECRLIDYSNISDLDKYLEGIMLSDLRNYYNILKAENEINRLVYRSLRLSKEVIKGIEEVFGENKIGCELSIERVDGILSGLLDINCQVVGAKKSDAEIGSDNLIDLACSKLNCSPEVLYDFFVQNVALMKSLKQRYFNDLIHKIFLKANGVSVLLDVKESFVIPNIKAKMVQICPAIGTISERDILEIYGHHVKSFFGIPFLSL